VSKTVDAEMQQFLALIDSLKQRYSVQELFPYTYILHPAVQSAHAPHGKKIPLTFFGVIHGNETAGIAILNEILAFLVSGQLQLSFPLGLALGNYRAVLQGARYLDKDLNRSFGSAPGAAWEIKRAEELASMLLSTWCLIDFHQTSQPSLEPFFIFPYSRDNLQFARALSPHHAVVTHWQGGFSQDGMATDEFLTKNKGIGVTFETGHNGLSPYQISLGALVGIKALGHIAARLEEHALRGKLPQRETPYNDLYTWAHVQAYPQGEVVLKPGLVNFQGVEKGEQLGTCDGAPFLAAASGKLLFPKYVDAGVDQGRRPAEIWRIIRAVRPGDLPK
jgi:hypothetical protein